MSDGTVGVKLIDGVFSAELARIVRKYRRASMFEIKSLVERQDYLFSCDYIDETGLRTALLLHRELDAVGIENALYEHDKPAAEELLCNWLQTMGEIAREVELDMEREAQEEQD